MLRVFEASKPVGCGDYWTQEVMLRDEEGVVAVKGYCPNEPSPNLYEQSEMVAKAAVLCPGFGESKDHPTLAATAAGFAARAGFFAVTLDPRGFHGSAHPGQKCEPGRIPSDIASIATLISPTEQLVLGGQSMGGAMATQAAVRLGEQAGGAVAPSHIVALKTPATATDHTRFQGFWDRAAKARPFFGVGANGCVVREQVLVGPDVFDTHNNNAKLAPLLAALGKQAVPPQVLLMPSSEDAEVHALPLQELADEHDFVTYKETMGEHSDYSPLVAVQTAAAIVDWHARTDRAHARVVQAPGYATV